MGDFPTLAFPLLFDALPLRSFLVRSTTLCGCACDCGGGTASRSMSSGELVLVAIVVRSSIVIGSDCACRAGEVSGLKYALGTANA